MTNFNDLPRIEFHTVTFSCLFVIFKINFAIYFLRSKTSGTDSSFHVLLNRMCNTFSTVHMRLVWVFTLDDDGYEGGEGRNAGVSGRDGQLVSFSALVVQLMSHSDGTVCRVHSKVIVGQRVAHYTVYA